MRTSTIFFTGTLLLTTGCSGCPNQNARGGGEEGGTTEDAALAVVTDAAPKPREAFSNSALAATLAPDGSIFVAGQSTPSRRMIVERFSPQGKRLWSRVADEVTAVPLKHGRDLSLHVVNGGVLVLSSGTQDGGGDAIYAVLASPEGKLSKPVGVTPPACVTNDFIFWVSPGEDGGVVPRVTTFDGKARQNGLAPGMEPTVACTTKNGFLVTETDKNIVSVSVTGADAPAKPALAVRKGSEGAKMDVASFTAGDALVIAQIAGEGDVRVSVNGGEPHDFLKLLNNGALLQSWGDDKTLVFAFFREEGCAETKGTLTVATIDRATWASHTADVSEKCTDAAGPVWVEPIAGGHKVIWVESQETKNGAVAITRVLHRDVGPNAKVGPIAKVGEAIYSFEHAGCKGGKCFGVTFGPATDSAAFQPAVLSY